MVSRRLLASLAVAFGLCASGCPADGPPYFISGSAMLPDCTETPSVDFTGVTLFDNGTVTITGTGCADAMVGEMFDACSLNWDVVSVEGNDIEILVDNEYTILGRVCGDQLHLEGGWWLPVEDGSFGCTYEEDSADEVGIQTGGSTLTINTIQDITGVLSVEGSCTAEYNVTFVSL